MLLCLASSIPMSIRSEPLVLMIYEFLPTFCIEQSSQFNIFLVSISICLSLSIWVIFKFIFFKILMGRNICAHIVEWYIFVFNDIWYISVLDTSSIIALPCHSVSALVKFCSNCQICQSCYMDLSKLLDGFVKGVTWICQSCSMYFLPFAKKNKLKIDQDFQGCWCFCFELKVLNA